MSAQAPGAGEATSGAPFGLNSPWPHSRPQGPEAPSAPSVRRWLQPSLPRVVGKGGLVCTNRRPPNPHPFETEPVPPHPLQPLSANCPQRLRVFEEGKGDSEEEERGEWGIGLVTEDKS